MNTVKLLKTGFLYKTSGSCFFQFDKATVQYQASADLLFLIKNTMVSTKKVCRSVQSMLYY